MATPKITISFLMIGAGIVLAICWFAGAQTRGVLRMETREVIVRRFSVVSSKPFNEVESKIESGVGHPDMTALMFRIKAAKNEADLESAVNSEVGPTGIMQFNKFDLGEVLRKEPGNNAQVVRLLVGNPLIMQKMVKFVPDAGSYAPVTILIDQRRDGVHVSYDTMASFLAPYRNERALQVARNLDAKIEAMIKSAAL
jgi:uncharacterized protein (DUF302 family)